MDRMTAAVMIRLSPETVIADGYEGACLAYSSPDKWYCTRPAKHFGPHIATWQWRQHFRASAGEELLCCDPWD